MHSSIPEARPVFGSVSRIVSGKWLNQPVGRTDTQCIPVNLPAVPADASEMTLDTFRSRLAAFVVASAIIAIPSAAQNWDEVADGGGDAGDNLAGAHDLTASSYTTITGQIASYADVDIYRLMILNAASFSATTVKGSYLGGDVLDSWLYLFDASGNAVYSNSESPAGDPANPASIGANALLPMVGDTGLNPSGHGPTSDGVYYLAVSHYENMALDAGLNEMFEAPFNFGEDYTRINGPIGGTGVLDSWDDEGTDAGNYTVTITGTTLPVELTSFGAIVDHEAVILRWKTLSETNNSGFEIESAQGGGAFSRVGFKPGAGTTTTPQDYSFRVENANGANRFRLRQINTDGSAAYSQVVEVTEGIRGPHTVSRAYPNPFSQRASLSLAVPTAQEVTVELYSVLGQRVATMFDGYISADAPQMVVLDGGSLPSGFYVVKVTGERFADSQVVTLIR